MRTDKRRTLATLAILGSVLAACPAVAQETATATSETNLATLWEDFVHYVKIAQPELAQSFGKAILDSGAAPREVYRLSAETVGGTLVLAQAANLAGMKDLVEQIRKIIEQGYQDLRSDPDEISRSIEMLGGTMRAFGIASDRLKTSGEYAMPQLVQKLLDPQTPGTLRERIIVVLPRLGKDAVRPMSVAMQTRDEKLQEVLANALGRIEYPHAAPRLKELAEREGVLPQIKRAAELALISCVGQAALAKPAAEVSHEQAVNYYYQHESVAPDPRYETANVWYWDGDAERLTYRSVPREIFCDVYAMRMARLALAHNPEFYPAVSLWIAANLKRVADLPEGAADATYGEGTPSAEYFALAGGAKYLQEVLARALDDKNSAVAIGAIEALARTAGAENLVEPVAGGAQPLVAALGCGDRHVRFLAAVSLAKALPGKRFAGYEQVMAQLTEALRQTGKKTALLIVEDPTQRNMMKDALRGAGCEIIEAADIDGAVAAAHQSAGVDVAVLATRPDPVVAVSKFRADPLLVMLPAIVVGKTEALRSLAERDGRTVLVDDPAAVAAAIAEADKLAAGQVMTTEAAAAWAVRAAEAIRHLGLTGNAVFDISLAEGTLAATVKDQREEVRLAASKALAVMKSAAAQRAIASLAVDAQTPERVRVEAFKDLSDSLRRYGNQLTEPLSESVVAVVGGSGSPELLNAAAQALGAMALPSEKIKSLIVKTDN